MQVHQCYLAPMASFSRSNARDQYAVFPRWHLLPLTNTYAASYEYLYYLLRVVQRLAVAEFVHFTYPGITSCRKCSVPKTGGYSNDTFGNRFEVH